MAELSRSVEDDLVVDETLPARPVEGNGAPVEYTFRVHTATGDRRLQIPESVSEGAAYCIEATDPAWKRVAMGKGKSAFKLCPHYKTRARSWCNSS